MIPCNNCPIVGKKPDCSKCFITCEYCNQFYRPFNNEGICDNSHSKNYNKLIKGTNKICHWYDPKILKDIIK